MSNDNRAFHKSFHFVIFDMDTLSNLPGKHLLASSSVGVGSGLKNRWINIDVSRHNIELPPKGVFVGMEILPEEHYLSRTPFDGKSYNSPSVGTTTRSTRSQPSYESWINRGRTGWIRVPDTDFLIYIVVEIK